MTASGEPAPTHAPEPAASVDGVPIPATAVDAELARLRAGPAAARLPRDGTPDARQLRRWLTQRMTIAALLAHEHASRALEAPDATVTPDPSLLGTAAADVLTVSPTARAVFADVTRTVTVPDEHVRATYDRTRPTRPERWLIRQSFSRDAPPTTLPTAPTAVDPRTLVPETRTAGPDPTLVHSTLGWHLIAVDAVLPAGPIPYAEIHDQLAADLTNRARQTTFARWLDAEAARRIHLATGYEHPADPTNPDATHRH